MIFLIKAGQLILSLSILIVLHEFGHYLPARWFNTRVEKFYLFCDYKFSLFKKKIKDTEWGIGWIPLGGYVKISGMIDESMDTEQMKQPPKDYEFRTKKTWQRLIIMIGGIVVNFIVGILIFIMVLFVWGKDYYKMEDLPNGFAVHDTFKKYGFQDGDKILTINGEVPMDVLEVNIALLVRSTSKIGVEHQDGTRQEIELHEDIEWEMFESGAMPAFVPRTYIVIDSLDTTMNALKQGFMEGDSIVSVNNGKVEFFDQFVDSLQANKGENVVVGFYRGDSLMTLPAAIDTNGTMGFVRKNITDWVKPRHKDYGFGESIPAGFDKAFQTLNDYVVQMKFIFTAKGASSIGGFGSFGSLFSPTWDWHSFWSMTAFISIILAFMNFLPIPALDGGHIMFLLYEMISGRKPNEKFMEYAQMVGIILLLGLLVYANGNDIYKAIFGK
jgi:regulator of sigma E protease